MNSTSVRAGRRVAVTSLAVALGFAISLASASQANAFATPTTVNMGAAQSFAVLGAETVTNTGPSIISGDVGVTAGSGITGFPPGVITGSYGLHSNTAAAIAAKSDLLIAYGDAESRLPDSMYSDLSGLTLTTGVYSADDSQELSISGTLPLILDGEGNPDAVWIFQAQTTLITASSSTVVLINEASPCNVFWQVGSSATLGTGSTMVGTVMALQLIAANTGANVEGRLLALNDAVTLDDTTVDASECAGAAAQGGTRPIPADTAPELAETGADVGLPLIAIVALIGGGAALLMTSGRKSRSRREGRLSE